MTQLNKQRKDEEDFYDKILLNNMENVCYLLTYFKCKQSKYKYNENFCTAFFYLRNARFDFHGKVMHACSMAYNYMWNLNFSGFIISDIINSLLRI